MSLLCLYSQVHSFPVLNSAQSAGDVEYTDCIPAVESDPPNKCPVYDTKQFDVEVNVMLELLIIQSSPLLSLLPGQPWPRMIAPDSVLSISQIELFDM